MKLANLMASWQDIVETVLARGHHEDANDIDSDVGLLDS